MRLSGDDSIANLVAAITAAAAASSNGQIRISVSWSVKMMSTSSSTNQSGTNKAWELSLYELNREPQRIVTDDTEIRVSPRTLHSELMCPICLDLLKKTMTTKECLHRFCSECIITALRSGNKECPTCRKKLASKRSLRPDPNFDLLIETLYPNREEYEAHQVKAMEKLNKSQSQAALVQSINEGIKVQNQTRFQRINKRTQNEADTFDTNLSAVIVSVESTTAEPQPSTSGNKNSPINDNGVNYGAQRSTKRLKSLDNSKRDTQLDINTASPHTASTVTATTDDFQLVFKPHPCENDSTLTKFFNDDVEQCFKMSTNATVGHINKYVTDKVAKEYGIDLSSVRLRFSILSSSNSSHFIQLNEKDTLRYIIDNYWQFSSPLELYYVSTKT